MTTQVDKDSLTAVKYACDDAVQLHLNEKWTQSHAVEDIRLAVGWIGSLIMIAGTLYAHFRPFAEVKPALTVCVVLYAILISLFYGIGRFVVKDSVYTGYRKSLKGERVCLQDSRQISNEHLQVDAHVEMPDARFSNLLFFWRKNPTQAEATPRYVVRAAYILSTNKGRAILHDAVAQDSAPLGTFFDVNGVFQETSFLAFLDALLAQVLPKAE